MAAGGSGTMRGDGGFADRAAEPELATATEERV
jgi:hypothetical protein